MYLFLAQGDRSTTMTGMSMASSLNSSLSRGDMSPGKKRSTTADEIFEKEFKDKSKKDAPLKCKEINISDIHKNYNWLYFSVSCHSFINTFVPTVVRI